MALSDLLSRLQPQAPNQAAKKRIAAKMQQRIQASSPLMVELRETVTPKSALKKALWQRVYQRVFPFNAFCELKEEVTPTNNLNQLIRGRVLQRIEEPVKAYSRGFAVLKWAAAFAFIGLVVRISPFIFIAAPTVAETQAVVLPTRGEVSVSISGLWQPVTNQIAVEPGMLLRTHAGEASLVLHDDAVVRLAPNTTIELHDVSNRLEPSSMVTPSFTLYTGQLWVQGLIPDQLRGLTVKTTYGLITVNEGSVSIAEDDYVDIAVYDRRAAVYRNGEPTFLTMGERTRLGEGAVNLVKKILPTDFQSTWAEQNLARDAVHRRGIAQLQHERRLAAAGILPSSPLYSVKRFAETVDLMLTFSSEARLQKQLARAETRLNEAAALIADGKTAEEPLQEYKQALQAVASGSGNVSLAQFLVGRALSETAANVSATLPGDDAYAVKKAFIKATAELPADMAPVGNAEGELLIDGLAALVQQADAGDVSAARAVWSDLQPYLLSLEDENVQLDPAMHKEAQTLLRFVASELHDASGRGIAVDPELLDDVSAFLPPVQTTTVTLSEEEIMDMVRNIRQKIFVYDMKQSRVNQFIAEMRALQGHPDQGRILRRLARVLPQGPEEFPDRVYKEIVRLRWETAIEVL